MISSLANGQERLDPPFGLCWGDSPEKLILWASRLALNVTITLPGDKPTLRILRVASNSGNLPDTEVSAVEGRFLGGKLFELAVHYDDPSVPADQMANRFTKLKRQISTERGAMLLDQQGKNVIDNFTIQTLSYYREQTKGLTLLLASTLIKDELRKDDRFRFTLIYRNENLRSDTEMTLR